MQRAWPERPAAKQQEREAMNAPDGIRTWIVGALGLALTVAAVLAIGRRADGQPLDPRSHERLGTSALVALAGELGAEVTISEGLPDLGRSGGEGGGPDVIVLLSDLLGSVQSEELDAWVEDGGRLVVTDPGSSFAPPAIGSFEDLAELGTAGMDTRCEVDALDGIDVGGVEPRNGGLLYEVGLGAQGCIDGPRSTAFLVADDRGAGTIVAFGGSGLVVNAALAEGENAAVVAAFVAPEPGTEVVVLRPGTFAAGTGGERSLFDLVPDGVKRALVVLAAAFTLYALWRARRLGRPVAEPQAVAVAGSELVAAVGNLLDRTRSPAHAAELLRADLRRVLADSLGVPAGSPPDVIATVAGTRTGIDEAELRWALGREPVTDDAGLVALARTIDRIREEVLAHV
jgi:hypothetical protein